MMAKAKAKAEAAAAAGKQAAADADAKHGLSDKAGAAKAAADAKAKELDAKHDISGKAGAAKAAAGAKAKDLDAKHDISGKAGAAKAAAGAKVRDLDAKHDISGKAGAAKAAAGAKAKELDEKAGAAIDARSVPAENLAVTGALAGKPSVRPSVVVSWGGIGAGKSSAAELLFAQLPMAHSDCVLVGVDDLVELVAEYRAAVESGDAAQKEAAYMEYRGQGKALKGPVIAAAVARRCNLYLEWTYEGNLQEFAACSDKAEVAYEAEGYDVVLMLVSCHDLEGIQANAAKRQRTIPPDTISKFNLDRTKYFVEAANRIKVERPGCNLRAFIVEREDANANGVLTDVTAALPFAEPEGGWTEAAARAATQAVTTQEGTPAQSDDSAGAH